MKILPAASLLATALLLAACSSAPRNEAPVSIPGLPEPLPQRPLEEPEHGISHTAAGIGVDHPYRPAGPALRPRRSPRWRDGEHEGDLGEASPVELRVHGRWSPD